MKIAKGNQTKFSKDFEQWASDPDPLPDIDEILNTISEGSREISTFSSSEIRHMKRAADFLHSINKSAKAFLLYTTILKYLKALAGFPESMVLWITIACATTASTTSQLEISRALLDKKLDELPGAVTYRGEAFLLHRLLANIYYLLGDAEKHMHSVETAYGFLADAGTSKPSTIAHLSMDHLSLDLYLYSFIVNDGSAGEFPIVRQHWHPLRSKAIQDALVHQLPGPFETRAGIMENPCLRSCVEWCYLVLREKPDFHSILAPSQSRLKDLDLREICLLVHTDLWAIWQRWCEAYPAQNLSTLPLWMTKSEKLMGISACNILRVVTKMSMEDVIGTSPLLECLSEGLIPLAVKGFERVMKMRHEFLARRFLDTFSTTQKEDIPISSLGAFPTFIEARWKLHESSSHQDTAWDTVKAPFQQKILRSQQQATDVSCIQDNSSKILPPLARSLRSSKQYSSFRALANRIAKSRDAKSESTKPSRMIRSSSLMSLAVEELSFLCRSLGSSLSLSSSLPEPSVAQGFSEDQSQNENIPISLERIIAS
ncbi:MAG: hypothetical protein M1822_009700 [Bathelium mastoideum]|nr:MAG: hypothetical protein M1822_009700 [Bathelium mastoideum]